MVAVAPSLPRTGSIGAVRTPEDDSPERDECRTDDIVQMDAVPSSGEDEEDPVKAIGIEPDDRRTDEDGHHCKQPHQVAEQPSGGKPRRAPLVEECPKGSKSGCTRRSTVTLTPRKAAASGHLVVPWEGQSRPPPQRLLPITE